MTISEFRNNIATYLDRAVQGELITIERGGVVFTIQPSVTAIQASQVSKEGE